MLNLIFIIISFLNKIFIMSSIEEKNVKLIYNKIANEFDNTRYRPWTCVESFLDPIDPNSSIGDIGCGNGKNMLYRKDCNNYGCDFSENLVNICLKKNLNVVVGDVLNIPFQNNKFDNTICIAVIHHLSTIEKREKAIQELIRITKPNGRILILVWAFEQEKDSRRKFTKQDNMVDWKDKKGNLLGKRYYYVFKENELESLLININNVTIEKSFYEKSNWGLILKKEI
tara:strand:+ start:99 stop:782 length:684 start_codon:yes stop_codon:yes gene_type:complete